MKTRMIFFSLIMICLPLQSYSQDEAAKKTVEEVKAYGPMDLWGVGLKAGLNGVGLEIVKGFGDRLNLRLGYTTLTIPYSLEPGIQGYDLKADANIRLGGASFLADYYLVKNGIQNTAGKLQNNTRISFALSSLSDMPFGDLMIPTADVGTLDAELTLGMPVSPYLGLGFGNTLSRKHRLSFNFELGALYHGGAKLALDGVGVVGPLGSEYNETTITDAIKQYSWLPALNFQLTYRIL